MTIARAALLPKNSPPRSSPPCAARAIARMSTGRGFFIELSTHPRTDPKAACAYGVQSGREAGVNDMNFHLEQANPLFERIMTIPETTQAQRAAEVRALLVRVMQRLARPGYRLGHQVGAGAARRIRRPQRRRACDHLSGLRRRGEGRLVIFPRHPASADQRPDRRPARPKGGVNRVPSGLPPWPFQPAT